MEKKEDQPPQEVPLHVTAQASIASFVDAQKVHAERNTGAEGALPEVVTVSQGTQAEGGGASAAGYSRDGLEEIEELARQETETVYELGEYEETEMEWSQEDEAEDDSIEEMDDDDDEDADDYSEANDNVEKQDSPEKKHSDDEDRGDFSRDYGCCS